MQEDRARLADSHDRSGLRATPPALEVMPGRREANRHIRGRRAEYEDVVPDLSPLCRDRVLRREMEHHRLLPPVRTELRSHDLIEIAAALKRGLSDARHGRRSSGWLRASTTLIFPVRRKARRALRQSVADAWTDGPEGPPAHRMREGNCG
jgi:hypothetical protein